MQENETPQNSSLTLRSVLAKYVLSCGASFAAESVYSGFRMGIYEVMRAAMFDETKQAVFPMWQSAICGLVSGAVAQFLASPTDLVKVQMQTEGLRKLYNLPPR
ncbi:unnamed protein product [Gongylonema pulchrum]|uniref:Mitochondrial substrate carrier family protein n=1 Tax=Gongylonema pulchrum TaxID=637853 RepID=A0A183E360_9BILA|nr:unnamed protein product [Gongylonema pulchrum]